MKQTAPNQPISPEEEQLIESLLHYPSLDEVFDPTDEKKFQSLKQKMHFTIDDLERVVRRGSNDDAAKAMKVLEAYKVVINFLDDLDSRRRK